MSAKSLLFSVMVAAFIVWVVIPSRQTEVVLAKPRTTAAQGSKAAPYQRELDKARGLGDQMQKDLDRRMKSDPAGK